MTSRIDARFSVICQTDDEAVYYCLLALWRWAEGAPPDGLTDDRGENESVQAWRARGGELALYFSGPRTRGAFLGEATRLLSGKWLRVGPAEGAGA